MYYTIYKITNKINGKQYIGAHKTDDLKDNYVGSGTYVKRAIKKHGWERFEKEILFVFDSRKDTYNLKIGGEGGWDHINSNLELRRIKNQKAMSIANDNGASEKGVAVRKELLKDDDWVKNRQDKIVVSTIKNHGDKAFKHMLGKTHSEDAKKKISETRKKNKIGHGSSNSQYGGLIMA